MAYLTDRPSSSFADPPVRLTAESLGDGTIALVEDRTYDSRWTYTMTDREATELIEDLITAVGNLPVTRQLKLPGIG